MKTHTPMHEPELPFGHPGRNFDDTPEHFDHFYDQYEPPPGDPPEEKSSTMGPATGPSADELAGDELVTHKQRTTLWHAA